MKRIRVIFWCLSPQTSLRPRRNGPDASVKRCPLSGRDPKSPASDHSHASSSIGAFLEHLPIALLRLADQRFEPLSHRRGLVETVVHFAGIDQIVALAPADVDAVPLPSWSAKPAMDAFADIPESNYCYCL
jgi:hypothetical protein